MATHPLEPLSADEFRQTAAVLRRDSGVTESWRFASIELKEANLIELTTENTETLKSLEEIVIGKLAKRNIDLRNIHRKDPLISPLGHARQEIHIQQGLEGEKAKEISKTINIPIVDDRSINKDLEFQIALSHPTGGGALGVNTLTVTIRDTESTYTPYTFTELAGSARQQDSADRTGSAARFNYPSGVAVDSAGNVYVADTGNNTIRKVTSAGMVTTLAGLARGDTSVDWARSVDGAGSTARFKQPFGVAVDSAGNLYVADAGNYTIRKVTPAGAVTTLAGGTGTPGSADGTGGAARFAVPNGVAVDSAGNVYVADGGNGTIRKITPAGAVTTLAGLVDKFGNADGTGSVARFSNPSGVAVDCAGNLYVADTYNNTIRKGYPALIIVKSGFGGRQFVVNLTGQVGQSVVLETSTDLVKWLPAQSTTFETRQITLTDPDASNFTRRFYRAYYRPIFRGE
jgi:hypothetical protein